VGNFEDLADKVLTRSKQIKEVSCFPPLGEEIGNPAWLLGNLCRNNDKCKYKCILINQGIGNETEQETIRKLHALREKLFTSNSSTESFLAGQNLTICLYIKLLKLVHLLRELDKFAGDYDVPGGDDPRFLNEVINETICDNLHDLDMAIKCVYDNLLQRNYFG
jgi:hypothetical protein